MSNITQNWIKLLEPFTTNYSEKYTGTELSRKTGIPQQTASRYLKGLVKKNILNYEIRGKNKLFFLDISKSTTKNILETIENQKALNFHQKAKEASIIIEDILKYSESVILFGSYSSYTHTKNSDLDIVILEKHSKKKIKELKNKYNIQINEHYISFRDLKEKIKSKNSLAIEIIKNHIFFGNISLLVKTLIEAYR